MSRLSAWDTRPRVCLQVVEELASLGYSAEVITDMLAATREYQFGYMLS